MKTTIGSEIYPLRLLILNSSQDETGKILHVLREAGFSLKTAHAKNDDETRVALTKYEWDLILSPADHLPPAAIRNFSALAWRESRAPLLLLANDNGPESFNGLEYGARDIINLHTPERLKHVISREMHDLTTRRTLHFYEQRFTAHNEEPPASETNNADIDISPQSRHQQDSASSEQRDELTQLYTRNYFSDELKQVINNLGNSPDKYALLHIEVDNFKQLRDSSGLPISNKAITDIATILHHCLGRNCPVARFKEHAFVILAAFNEQWELSTLAEKIGQRIACHIFTGPKRSDLRITCSIGVCLVIGQSNNSHQLLAKAQKACNIASQCGGDMVHFYNPETDAGSCASNQRNWEESIRQALHNDRFRLVYQPIINLNALPHENYEILLRMIDDDGADIMPAQFILIAEQTGLITAIDQWVVKNALTRLATQNSDTQPTNLFIKLSRASVNSSFIDWLRQELATVKIPENCLVFEISAVGLNRHSKQTKIFIEQLKSLNCRSTLEYFGVQNDAIELIRKLPADFFKIDRALIHNLPQHPQNEKTIRSIITSAHACNKSVIGEFIQDARTLSILWSTGIDYIQGNFLQQPDNEMNYDFSGSTM